MILYNIHLHFENERNSITHPARPFRAAIGAQLDIPFPRRRLGTPRHHGLARHLDVATQGLHHFARCREHDRRRPRRRRRGLQRHLREAQRSLQLHARFSTSSGGFGHICVIPPATVELRGRLRDTTFLPFLVSWPVCWLLDEALQTGQAFRWPCRRLIQLPTCPAG